METILKNKINEYLIHLLSTSIIIYPEIWNLKIMENIVLNKSLKT